MNEKLSKAITMGLRSGDFCRAFKDAGGEPACGSWGNAVRQFNAARAAAQPKGPPPSKTPLKTPAKQSQAAPSTGGTDASVGASTQGRTGTIKEPMIRDTSKQAAQRRSLERAYWDEYKEAHKAATVAYDEAKRLCALRKEGSRPADIAARFDNVLSEGNPER